MIRKTLAKIIIFVVLIQDQIFDTCIFTLFGEFEKNSTHSILINEEFYVKISIKKLILPFFSLLKHMTSALWLIIRRMKRNCSEKSETSKKKWRRRNNLKRKRNLLNPILTQQTQMSFTSYTSSLPKKLKKNGKICPKNHFWNNGFCVAVTMV